MRWNYENSDRIIPVFYLKDKGRFMEQKACKDCGVVYPVTREFFGQYRNKRSDGSVKIAFRNSCRKCMAANTRRYDAENPDNVAARAERRKQAEINAEGSYTSDDIHKIRQMLGDRCRFCGCTLDGKGQIEHLTPLSRGGSNNPSNLTLSCLKCNYEKTKKTLEEYLAWRQERKLPIHQINYLETPDKPTITRRRKSY